MTNNPKEPPIEVSKGGITDAELRELRVIQYLLIGAAILCPVSIFLGVLFSMGATACAIIALVKVSKLSKRGEAIQKAAQRIQTVAIVCLCLSGIILAMNIMAIIIMYPIVLEAVQTGDYSSLGLDAETLGDLSSGGSSGNGSKTWG